MLGGPLDQSSSKSSVPNPAGISTIPHHLLLFLDQIVFRLSVRTPTSSNSRWRTIPLPDDLSRVLVDKRARMSPRGGRLGGARWDRPFVRTGGRRLVAAELGREVSFRKRGQSETNNFLKPDELEWLLGQARERCVSPYVVQAELFASAISKLREFLVEQVHVRHPQVPKAALRVHVELVSIEFYVHLPLPENTTSYLAALASARHRLNPDKYRTSCFELEVDSEESFFIERWKTRHLTDRPFETKDKIYEKRDPEDPDREHVLRLEAQIYGSNLRSKDLVGFEQGDLRSPSAMVQLISKLGEEQAVKFKELLSKVGPLCPLGHLQGDLTKVVRHLFPRLGRGSLKEQLLIQKLGASPFRYNRAQLSKSNPDDTLSSEQARELSRVPGFGARKEGRSVVVVLYPESFNVDAATKFIENGHRPTDRRRPRRPPQRSLGPSPRLYDSLFRSGGPLAQACLNDLTSPALRRLCTPIPKARAIAAPEGQGFGMGVSACLNLPSMDHRPSAFSWDWIAVCDENETSVAAQKIVTQRHTPISSRRGRPPSRTYDDLVTRLEKHVAAGGTVKAFALENNVPLRTLRRYRSAAKMRTKSQLRPQMASGSQDTKPSGHNCGELT